MDYRTFNQWSAAGYKINKGSKAVWIDNVPMFSGKQVTKSPPRRIYSYGDYSGYYDSYDEYEDAMQYDPWMGGYF